MSIVRHAAAIVLIPTWVISRPRPTGIHPSQGEDLRGQVCHREHCMASRVYRFVVTGEMGPAMREAFPELDTRTDDGRTVLSGELIDQPAVYSVLDRLQALGLDLVDVSVEGDQG